MSSAAREGGDDAPRRLVVRAADDVVCVGDVADVFGGGGRAVLCLERDGTRVEEVLLLRLRHGVLAVVNRCPHLGRSLDDARLRGHMLTCRGHGRSYNLRSGRPAGTLAPGPPRLRRVPAWISGGRLFADVRGIV
ncbi:MAG: Rieske 2Fe-2S domain-containing protein [Nocardiopsaceae bacterium]|nr:Rieske 2Fe-2S domain-containing protein [Nocardiopsaceae bacterium]